MCRLANHADPLRRPWLPEADLFFLLIKQDRYVGANPSIRMALPVGGKPSSEVRQVS